MADVGYHKEEYEKQEADAEQSRAVIRKGSAVEGGSGGE